MYGKLFDQMYESSLCDDWRALITFQQFIILADMQGVVDMTPEAVQRRTNIPLDIIKRGIGMLERPDPRSRSPMADGRRIERLDAHRDWGWQIVNYQYYRNLASMEEKREADRQRIAKKRATEKPIESNMSLLVADGSGPSQPVANVAHLEADREEEVEEKTIGRPVGRFTDFWKAYPKKVKRKTSEQVWKLKNLDAMADKLIEDVRVRLDEDYRWKGGFIPDPPTYLRQERWADEITPAPERRR